MCAAAVTNEVHSSRVVRHRDQLCRSLPSTKEFKEEQYVFSMRGMVKTVTIGRLLGTKPLQPTHLCMMPSISSRDSTPISATNTIRVRGIPALGVPAGASVARLPAN